MTWSMYLPLILGGIAFGVTSVVAGVIASRGNDAARGAGARLRLPAAARDWRLDDHPAARLDLQQPNDVGDMLIITLVIVVFFALLLFVFFGISLLVGASGARRSAAGGLPPTS